MMLLVTKGLHDVRTPNRLYLRLLIWKLAACIIYLISSRNSGHEVVLQHGRCKRQWWTMSKVPSYGTPLLDCFKEKTVLYKKANDVRMPLITSPQ